MKTLTNHRRWAASVGAILVSVAVVALAMNLRARGATPPWPDGLVRSTPTPDTSHTVDATAAAKQLTTADPRFKDVLDAVANGDSTALLASIDWQPSTCSAAGSLYCPGAAIGGAIQIVDVGSAVSFYVTPDALRPSLDLLLKGDPLTLRYVSRLKSKPTVYYLGFESASAKGKGIPPVTDSDFSLTGMLLTLDTGAVHPIVHLDPSVHTEFHATDKGLQIGVDDQQIITFDSTR